MKTTERNQIIAEIEALEIKFKAIPCDNNGCPTDWITYHRLLSAIENREAILDGKPLECGGNYRKILTN